MVWTAYQGNDLIHKIRNRLKIRSKESKQRKEDIREIMNVIS